VAQGGGPEFKPHYGRKNAERDQEDSNLKSTQANSSGYQFRKKPITWVLNYLYKYDRKID
jgi:hypothetical protein